MNVVEKYKMIMKQYRVIVLVLIGFGAVLYTIFCNMREYNKGIRIISELKPNGMTLAEYVQNEFECKMNRNQTEDNTVIKFDLET